MRTRRIITICIALALVVALLWGIVAGLVKLVRHVKAKSATKQAYAATMEARLDKMSLEDKVGQMILAYQPKDALKMQKKYQFGGYVFFSDYFQNSTPESVVADMKAYQEASKVGMLLAVDEEGGTVNRISKFRQYRDEPFASPQEVYYGGQWDGIVADTKEKAAFLKILGLNTNLAPVADVPYKKSNYIYHRAFSTDAEETAEYVGKVTTEYQEAKVLSCLKHFPGYGDGGNTHRTVIEDTRDKQILETRDVLPFQAGIQQGTPMVMVNHIIVDAYDAKTPASLSKPVHNVLRKQLGFKGVIVTDALEMDGVTKFVNDPAKVAVLAVQAGNDLLCTGYPAEQYKAILKAVRDGTITEERIDESVLRILKMKNTVGLVNR